MLSVGQRIRIFDKESAFHLKTGRITSKIFRGLGYKNGEPDFVVKLDRSPLSVHCTDRQLISTKQEDELTTTNLYSRYMWIRFEAMSEVLELMKCVTSLEDAQEIICTYMHSNYRRCFRNPLDVLPMLPDKNRVKLNELVRTMQDGKPARTGL